MSYKKKTKRGSQDSDAQSQLIETLIPIHIQHPSSPTFSEEMEKVAGLRSRLDSLFFTRKPFLAIRSRDISENSKYYTDFDLLKDGDNLQFHDLFLDRLGLIVMCTVISDIEPRMPKISYSLYCTGLNGHVDLLKIHYDHMFKNLLKMWIEKSDILNGKIEHGVEVIRSGLLLKIKVDFKSEAQRPDSERGHEIYMCIEKRLLGTNYVYNFYLYDINANDAYVEIPSLRLTTNVFIEEYLKSYMLEWTGMELNVFTYNIRQLIPVYFPNVKYEEFHEPQLIPMGVDGYYKPYNLFDTIGYMCTTAARRIAIYCACSVEIKDVEIFDERQKENYLFYQNYITYLTQTYRMAIWVMENPDLWHHTTDERVLTRVAQMNQSDRDGYMIDKTVWWPVITMADSFLIKFGDLSQYYQSGSLDNLVVRLESSKSYITIVEFLPDLDRPGSKLQKTKKYWYQQGSPDQTAFVHERYQSVPPTCRQMSHFDPIYYQFR